MGSSKIALLFGQVGNGIQLETEMLNSGWKGGKTMAERNETNVNKYNGGRARDACPRMTLPVIPAGFRPHPFLPVYVCPCESLAEIVERGQKISQTRTPSI
ncbi:MAG: hypothetical protein ABII09_03785 [Planctomycetota bacterium]